MKLGILLSLVGLSAALQLDVRSEDVHNEDVISPRIRRESSISGEKSFNEDMAGVGEGRAHHIEKRRSGPLTCRYPRTPRNYMLHCKTTPSKVICKQKCMFGYTLKTSTTRTMTCDRVDGKWSPSSTFEECKPYADCGVTLGPGGGRRCWKNRMDEGPSCEIYCRPYADYPGVPSQTYRCDTSGEWSPSLPHCAIPGSGMLLVPPPYE